MLLNFSVSNYGSIASNVSIVLTAINSYHEHDESLIAGKWPGFQSRGVLPAVALYGANGSGKSTVLEAFETLCLMVTNPPARADEPLPFRPHLGLSAEEQASGTTLSASILAPEPSQGEGGRDGDVRLMRYDYAVAFNGERILREELYAYPKSRPQKWFARKGLDISCSNGVRMGRELKGLINDNTLALAVVSNHPNYEGTKKVRPVSNWFRNAGMTKAIGSIASWELAYTGEMLLGNSGSDRSRSLVRTMLTHSDVGIAHAKIVDHERSPEAVEKIAKKAGVSPEEVPNVLHEVVFEHPFPTGTRDVSVFEESDGTMRMFCASGKIATVLDRGGVLVADELDASLHTSLFEEIVRLFMTPATNPNGAQLVFSAQNPHLLGSRILRRDQVWFADKDHRGATHVYPLSDYAPRQDESVASGYILGRYSAVPVIPDLFGLAENAEADNEGDVHGA